MVEYPKDSGQHKSATEVAAGYIESNASRHGKEKYKELDKLDTNSVKPISGREKEKFKISDYGATSFTDALARHFYANDKGYKGLKHEQRNAVLNVYLALSSQGLNLNVSRQSDEWLIDLEAGTYEATLSGRTIDGKLEYVKDKEAREKIVLGSRRDLKRLKRRITSEAQNILSEKYETVDTTTRAKKAIETGSLSNLMATLGNIDESGFKARTKLLKSELEEGAQHDQLVDDTITGINHYLKEAGHEGQLIDVKNGTGYKGTSEQNKAWIKFIGDVLKREMPDYLLSDEPESSKVEQEDEEEREASREADREEAESSPGAGDELTEGEGRLETEEEMEKRERYERYQENFSTKMGKWFMRDYELGGVKAEIGDKLADDVDYTIELTSKDGDVEYIGGQYISGHFPGLKEVYEFIAETHKETLEKYKGEKEAEEAAEEAPKRELTKFEKKNRFTEKMRDYQEEAVGEYRKEVQAMADKFAEENGMGEIEVKAQEFNGAFMGLPSVTHLLVLKGDKLRDEVRIHMPSATNQGTELSKEDPDYYEKEPKDVIEYNFSQNNEDVQAALGRMKTRFDRRKARQERQDAKPASKIEKQNDFHEALLEYQEEAIEAYAEQVRERVDLLVAKHGGMDPIEVKLSKTTSGEYALEFKGGGHEMLRKFYGPRPRPYDFIQINVKGSIAIAEGLRKEDPEYYNKDPRNLVEFDFSNRDEEVADVLDQMEKTYLRQSDRYEVKRDREAERIDRQVEQRNANTPEARAERREAREQAQQEAREERARLREEREQGREREKAQRDREQKRARDTKEYMKSIKKIGANPENPEESFELAGINFDVLAVYGDAAVYNSDTWSRTRLVVNNPQFGKKTYKVEMEIIIPGALRPTTRTAENDDPKKIEEFIERTRAEQLRIETTLEQRSGINGPLHMAIEPIGYGPAWSGSGYESKVHDSLAFRAADVTDNSLNMHLDKDNPNFPGLDQFDVDIAVKVEGGKSQYVIDYTHPVEGNFTYTVEKQEDLEEKMEAINKAVKVYLEDQED
jgi:hypothetical protein